MYATDCLNTCLYILKEALQTPQHEPELLPSEPPPLSCTTKRRRGAVSAAVISEEDAASYVKKVIYLFKKVYFNITKIIN